MSNMSEDIQYASSDTRPPMLDRTDFESWQQRIRLYCLGKDNGENIIKSITEGPFQIEMFIQTPAEETEGALQLGPKRARVFTDLSAEEKERYKADIRATNILLQGIPKDIYTLINHYVDAKDIWDNVKMILEGSELTKDARESQLYDEFEHFRQIKGETIHVYYVRFTKLINDMRNIKMTMPRMQLNSKFVNNMLPEWSRFITEVKLNRGLKESNFDQLYAYLKQHEYPTQSSMSPQSLNEPSPANNFQLDSGSSSTENLIESLTSTLVLLTQSYKSHLPQINNQLRTSSNARNKATRNNARGNVIAGNTGGQNRGGNVNPGQAKPIKCYNCNGLRHIARELLDEEQLLFLAGDQVNNFDDDVDDPPEKDLALNVDHIFEADQCDAFNSDIDEAPNIQTMFMVNLSSEYPIYDKARPSYDSNTPFEVQDHDTFVDHMDEYHEVHEMQNDVQHNYVVDSNAEYTSDSNIILYNQYVEDNKENVVQSNVSSVQNDALMSIINEMHEDGVQQGVQSRLANKPYKVVNDSLTSELARYKELLQIGKSNLLFDAQKIQKNPIFQISVDILRNTNFFRAFSASASVPAIYIQQFWNTMKYDEKTGVYCCQVDEQWVNLSVDLLRKALDITPVDPAHPFELPPTGDTVIDFVNQLGYPEPVEFVSNIRVNYVYQPWRAILSLINQCLTGKTSGSDKPRHPVLQMLWGIVTKTNIDHSKNCVGDDFLLGNLKFIPKGETDEVFGMKPPSSKLPKKSPLKETSPRSLHIPQEQFARKAFACYEEMKPTKPNLKEKVMLQATALKVDKEQGEVTSTTVTSGVRISVRTENQARSDLRQGHEALAGSNLEPMQEDSGPGKEHVALAGTKPYTWMKTFYCYSLPQNLDETDNFGDQFLNDKPTEDDQEKTNVVDETDSIMPDPSHQIKNKVVNAPLINTEATTIITTIPEITPFIALSAKSREIGTLYKYSRLPAPKSSRKQESEKSPEEILIIKREQEEQKHVPTYTIKSTDTAALKEINRKRPLLFKKTIHENKSANKNPANNRLYHALMEALIEDENAMEKEVADKVKDHKRKHDSDDKMKALPAGSNQVVNIKSEPQSEQSSDDIQIQMKNKISAFRRQRKLKFKVSVHNIMETGDIAILHQIVFCKRTGKKKLCKADLEGPTFNLVKSFHKNSVSLQFQMDECYKLLTDKVDLVNPEGHQILRNLKAARYLDFGLEELVPSLWVESERDYDISAAYGITHWWVRRKEFYINKHREPSDRDAVRSHMRILSVICIKTYKRYGYNYLREIVLRRADYKEYKISEKEFKNLHPNDFKDLFLPLLHFKTTQPTTYSQQSVESYQTKLNLEQPNWDASDFLFKEDYTIVNKPRAVIYRDRDDNKKMMRINKVHKFSDGTLMRIRDKLDFMVKDFRLFKFNKGMETRKWTEDDKRRSEDFIE
ncbi:hypothetical protein Tco_0798648 [Tanacetum coccineum]